MNLPKRTPQNANTAPTDRSNSPAIIRNVTPIASVPIDVVRDVMPPTCWRVNRFEDIVPKTSTRSPKPSSGPTSGRRVHVEGGDGEAAVVRLDVGRRRVRRRVAEADHGDDVLVRLDVGADRRQVLALVERRR